MSIGGTTSSGLASCCWGKRTCCSGRGNQNLGNELVFGRVAGIVHVVLDGVVVADRNLLFRYDVPHLARRRRQIGVGTGENESAVFTAFELLVCQAVRQIDGRAI